ncbi:hypothetical protein R2A130_0009 [Ahrensia sp. R2A130]|nr:hypothetical protein R2A130_0009 [Ahrensia sp. R2A130]
MSPPTLLFALTLSATSGLRCVGAARFSPDGSSPSFGFR